MARRLIDLSVPLENGVVADPNGLEPSITYLDHAQTREQMLRFFPGLTAGDLPDREGWAFEWVHLTTHNGTHLDAPYHYSATMDGGARAITIDLSQTDFIDSTGLHAIVMGAKQLREKGGDLALASPSKSTYRVLELTGLTRVLSIR